MFTSKNGFAVFCCMRKKSFLFHSSRRRFVQPDPRNWLVPDLVTMLIEPLDCRPFSAVVAARDDVHFTDRVDVRGDVRRAVAAFFADRHAVNRRVLVERVAAVDAQAAARVPLRVVAAGVSSP